jgi:predicted AAA+ superfamily ATPase
MLLKEDISKAYTLQQQNLQIQKPWIRRQKLESIAIDSPFIQIISGVRRCGKSTLLKLIIEQYKQIAYVNFEDARLFNFELSDFPKLQEIVPENVEAWFFDEIQNVENWEIYVRQLYEAGHKIFITGSNASLLSNELGTKLTGRYVRTELFPFSYAEYLSFTKNESSAEAVNAYLKSGGFPEFISTNNQEYLQQLLSDILLRDIAIRFGIRNTKALQDIALFLISNIGKEVSYQGIRKAFNIGSANTVIDYLSWMEEAYLFFFVQRFSWSARSMAINPRKIYAIDNGMINANTLSFNEDLGRKLENAIFIHLRNEGKRLYYFKQDAECDFLVFENRTCTQAIQVCHEINVDNKGRELKGLLEAMHFFKLKEGCIVTQNQKDRLNIEHKVIHLVPVEEFFLQSLQK